MEIGDRGRALENGEMKKRFEDRRQEGDCRIGDSWRTGDRGSGLEIRGQGVGDWRIWGLGVWDWKIGDRVRGCRIVDREWGIGE